MDVLGTCSILAVTCFETDPKSARLERIEKKDEKGT